MSCGFFYLLSFFPRLISAVADWMSTIIPHMVWRCGLSANLGRRSETCCTRLAENTGRKKIVKKSPSGHHRTTLSCYSFGTKARIDNRKKSSNISSTCPHNMVNFCPLRGTLVVGVRQPNFAALNRGRHLYLSGRPSLWAFAHISSC